MIEKIGFYSNSFEINHLRMVFCSIMEGYKCDLSISGINFQLWYLKWETINSTNLH